MPYPMRTAEGVAKAATREGFEATKADIESPVPVAEASQSTASLKRKGTCTFKTLAPTRKPKAVMTLKRNSGLSLIHKYPASVRRIFMSAIADSDSEATVLICLDLLASWSGLGVEVENRRRPLTMEFR